MKLVFLGDYEMSDGKVIQDVVMDVPDEIALRHPERESFLCRDCKEEDYPECKKTCGYVKEGLVK